MRVLVHSASMRSAPRMLSAAWGLAQRGNDVAWLGGDHPSGVGWEGAPAALRRVARARDARPADVLLAGAASPARAACAGWWAGAHAVVLDLTHAPPPGVIERALWETFDARRLNVAGADPVVAPAEGADPPDPPGRWGGVPLPPEPDPSHEDVEILERACEALAVRRSGPGTRPAVFLDRDGTLVVERGYLSRAEDIELLPGTARALRQLRAAGYALVVISNQSGVGRGLFPLSRVYEAMARLRLELRDHGVELQAVYFCPHRPDAGCDCRKPSGELLHRAASNLGLSLRESAMIGDKLLDVETGRRAGVRAVLVRTGYGSDEERRLEGDETGATPDHVAADLEAAAAWLIARRGAALR